MQLMSTTRSSEYSEHSLLCAFHYSPKKAEELAEVQAFLNAPEIKITKLSDTRLLAREKCVQAVRQSLPALVSTFNNIYEESGDAEAFGVSQLLCTYKFVACLYMLCDVLHTVAKLHGSLQSKQLDFATVSVMVESTIKRLREFKESPATSLGLKTALLFSHNQPTQSFKSQSLKLRKCLFE